MKIIFKSISDYIIESRSNDELNINISFEKLLKDLYSKYGRENIFVSFRDSIHVTDINKINKFSTPTGFYTYPIYKYLDYHQRYRSKNKLEYSEFNVRDFATSFPFAGNRQYISFFVLNDDSNVLYTSKVESDKYEKIMNNIESIYGDKHPLAIRIMRNNYDKYTNKDTVYFYMNVLRMVMYHIKREEQNKYNNVNYEYLFYNKIGLDGIVDDDNRKLFHQNEPSQAVFFKVKNIGKQFIFDTESGRYDSKIDII